jgi:hypothetical protein
MRKARTPILMACANAAGPRMIDLLIAVDPSSSGCDSVWIDPSGRLTATADR